MLDQLLATPGVEERCVLGSSFGFLALHGGLEAGTAEIAQAAAVASNASIYAVVQPDDMRWHVPSHAFDPSQSDALVAFLEHVDVVVSVHGFGGLRGDDDRWITGLLGGSNRELAAAARAAAARRAARLPLDRRSRAHPVAPARRAPRQPGEPPARTAACRSSCRPGSARPRADCAALVGALATARPAA